MARQSLSFYIEIKKLSIIVAERIQLTDLVRRTFKSKFNVGQIVTQDRKTPYITEDPDTMQFVKYYLHNKVKAHVLKDFTFDESCNFTKLNKHIHDIPMSKSRLILLEQSREERQWARIQEEREREAKLALEAQISNIDAGLESPVNEYNDILKLK